MASPLPAVRPLPLPLPRPLPLPLPLAPTAAAADASAASASSAHDVHTGRGAVSLKRAERPALPPEGEPPGEEELRAESPPKPAV